MKLIELQPKFLKLSEDKSVFSRMGNNFKEADGIFFLCPVCFAKNKGEIGTHGVICWFNNRGVPDGMSPSPGRWNAEGTGYDDLSFVSPGMTSVKLTSPTGCQAHFHVTKGEVA